MTMIMAQTADPNRSYLFKKKKSQSATVVCWGGVSGRLWPLLHHSCFVPSQCFLGSIPTRRVSPRCGSMGEWVGAGGGRAGRAALEVPSMPRRMAWLVVSTRFAVGSVHSVLLRCLVLGLGAKVQVPRILPRLVLELPHGVWGFPAACMALLSRCKVGAGVSEPNPHVILQSSVLGGLCHPRDAPRSGMHQHRDQGRFLLPFGGSRCSRE